jgi:Mg2+-importing ATPase
MRSMPSRLLLWTTLAVGVLALAIPYSGPLAHAFSFAPLTWPLALASLLVVAAYIATTELAKVAFYRGNRR